MENQPQGNPILDGVIWKQVLLFFFPILFGTFFQQLYNTVDALIVGRFIGKEALSAVGGSAGMIVNLILGFFVGLSSGAAVLVAQFYGAKDDARVNRAVHTVMVFSILCGAVITVIGLIFAPTLLTWLKTPADTMEQSILYLRVYFSGMIVNLVYNTGAGILRAAGDSRRPLYFLIISCLVNVILDILFVIPLHMGIFGAALATVLSQALSAAMVLLVMGRTKESYRLQRNRMHMDPHMLKDMIRIGFPAGLQAVMYGFSNALIQVAINDLGTDTVAAWAAYYKFDGIFWMTVAAFGVTVTTFVGQNYGAGDRKRVNRSIRTCLFMAMVSSALTTLVVYSICPVAFPFFTTDSNVQDIGIHMIRFLSRFYLLYVPVEILSGSLRGMGDTLVPMFMSAVCVCVFRTVWIFLLPEGYTMYRLMYCYPISWIMCSLLFILYYPLSKQVRLLRQM